MGCFRGPPKDLASLVKAVKGMWSVGVLLTILGVGVAAAGLAILSAVGSYSQQACPAALEKCFPGNSPGLGEYGAVAAQYGGYLGGPLIAAGLATSLVGITGAYVTGNAMTRGITYATVLYSLVFLVIAGAGGANMALGGFVATRICEEALDYQSTQVASDAISQTNAQCSAQISSIFNSVCEAKSTFAANAFYCNDDCSACDW
jgi:hypothetical protein